MATRRARVGSPGRSFPGVIVMLISILRQGFVVLTLALLVFATGGCGDSGDESQHEVDTRAKAPVSGAPARPSEPVDRPESMKADGSPVGPGAPREASSGTLKARGAGEHEDSSEPATGRSVSAQELTERAGSDREPQAPTGTVNGAAGEAASAGAKPQAPAPPESGALPGSAAAEQAAAG